MEVRPDVVRFDRLELKYVLDARQQQAIERVVRSRLQPDPYGDEDGCYPIISLYLDDDELTAFWDRDRDIASRRKLRVRIYGGAATRAAPACFLEIKHKYGGRTAKRRIALPVAQAMDLVHAAEGGAAVPPELPAREHLVWLEAERMIREGHLHPRCVMRYDRQAFLGAVDAPDLRITFDRRVRARARDLEPRADDDDFDVDLLASGTSILEIKVDQVVPWWLAEAMAALGPTGHAVSKYALAAEALLVPPFLAAARSARRPTTAPTRNGRTAHGHPQPVLR